MINTETQYIKEELLKEIVTNGHQFIVVHKDAMDIEIQGLYKTAVYSLEDDSQVRGLTINEISEILGHLFVPTSKFDTDYYLVHWCFDEFKTDGLTEQEMVKQLFNAYGYQNMRDLDNDNLNDTRIEDLDFEALKGSEIKYFGIFSEREAKYILKQVIENVPT